MLNQQDQTTLFSRKATLLLHGLMLVGSLAIAVLAFGQYQDNDANPFSENGGWRSSGETNLTPSQLRARRAEERKYTHPSIEEKLGCQTDEECTEKAILDPGVRAEDQDFTNAMTVLAQGAQAYQQTQDGNPVTSAISTGFIGVTNALGAASKAMDYDMQQKLLDDAIKANTTLAEDEKEGNPSLKRTGDSAEDKLENQRLDTIIAAQEKAISNYEKMKSQYGLREALSWTEVGLSVAAAGANIGTSFLLRDRNKEEKPDIAALLEALRNRRSDDDPGEEIPANNSPYLSQGDLVSENVPVGENDNKLKDLLADTSDSGGGLGSLDDAGGLSSTGESTLADSSTASDMKAEEGAKFLGANSENPKYAGGSGSGEGGSRGMPDFDSLFSKFLPPGEGDGSRLAGRLGGGSDKEEEGASDILGKEKSSLFAVVHQHYEAKSKELMQMQAALQTPLRLDEEKRGLAVSLKGTPPKEEGK